jgi:diguanylate cyclase (GGDEF)-like protein
MAVPRHRSEVERLRLVIEVQREINAVTLDIDELMRVVTEHAQSITGADGGVVELAEGDEMVYRAVSGAAAGSLGTRLGRATSLSGLCVRQAGPLRCDDSETDPRVDREACRRIGVRSMVVVPLLHAGDAVGVLKVMSGEPTSFDDADIEVLELLAGFIADALANASSHGRLGHQALHDPLTGLPNRSLLMDRLDQALERARRNGSEVAVLFVDLDGFKAVNDALGHAAGDDVLRAVAGRLAATLRAGETLARFGGDEFVLVCEDTSQAIDAVERRVSAAVAEVDAASGGLGLGVSVGLVRSSGAERGADEILAAADAEMYRTKQRHHGRS